jgi:hypothetical protein
VIERELPETGRLTPPPPDAISQTSCGIPPDPGTADSVGTSYVADDKSDRSYEQKQNGVALKTPASGSEF